MGIGYVKPETCIVTFLLPLGSYVPGLLKPPEGLDYFLLPLGSYASGTATSRSSGRRKTFYSL